MKKDFLKLLPLLILVVIFACGDLITIHKIDEMPGRVIMTAVYDSLDTNGNFIEKLVICDYTDPSNFEILTDDSFRVSYPKYSPDKNRILFGDNNRYATEAGPLLVIYDIETRSCNLIEYNYSTGFGLYGSGHIWNNDGTGFFYYDVMAVIVIFSTHYYDLTTSSDELVKRGKGSFGEVTPRAVISSDTLMVFSNDSVTTGQPPGFYFLDESYNYAKRINNPHLIGYNKNGYLREALGLDYDRESGLIVYSEHHTDTIGEKISVTNLDGSYYRNYTSGDFNDLNPVWGYKSETILFMRNPVGPSRHRDSRIMILDVKSGRVREFVSPSVINGAAGLRSPDY